MFSNYKCFIVIGVNNSCKLIFNIFIYFFNIFTFLGFWVWLELFYRLREFRLRSELYLTKINIRFPMKM